MNKKMRWPLVAAMFGALILTAWTFTPPGSALRSENINVANPRLRTPVKELKNYDIRNDNTSQAQNSGITFGTSYHNDTSPRLRDMVQVPLNPNEVGLSQSIKVPKAMTAGGADSGAIIVSGISADTKGEVGATQRVKIANKGYQIFDNRTGASVLSPSDISTIWAGFGGSCAAGGAGDAVVLYDKLADRWVISQFASATGGKAVTEECFAVSTTSDATGSYYRYAFHLGSNFIDSPHLSVRPNGYLMGDSVFNESGTERLGNQFFVFERTAMLNGAPATFTSPGVDTGVGETYSISAHGVRVASAPSIVPAVSTLTINLTYDPDSTFTSAGLTAQNITDMKAANAFAAAQFTNNFTDPINVNIRVTAVPGTGTLGGSSTSIFSQPFTTGIRDPTRADATTADDATMAGAGGSVPSGLADPIGGTHNWWVTRAQRKALSIAADDLTQDGTYTFGGGFTYTYDPNNRAVAGKYDYIGVSMHEFSEIMGRIGGLGVSIGGSPAYLQMDLFHYTGANTRGLTNGAGRFFSFNNGTALLKAFNNASVNGGDAQDWASGTNDAFNAFSSSGVKNDLTAVDLQSMDVIGYNFGTPGPVIQPDGAATITAESLSPPNGAPDPTEQVTASFPLKNVGSVSTTNLVATLQTSGGVTAIPTGENQNYGVVASGGATVSRPFTFRADGTCGATITATFQLQDGATNLGNVTFNFQLGTTNTTTALTQNFDGVVAPALPAGWTTTATGTLPTLWVTSTTTPVSAPNDAFAPDLTNIADDQLISPSIAIQAAGGQVTFKNLFNMESTFDGMVLEISINGGAFNDIITAGGSFVTGGYNATISSSFGSPIGGRMAWSGLSGGTTASPAYITTKVNLPATANGLPIVLKWRAASDNSAAAAGAAGVRVDDITVTTFTPVCTGALRIDSIAARAGRTSGGQQIVLTGAFPGLSTVTMGGVGASFFYTNGGGDTSKITVTTPAHAVGAVQIDLTPASGPVYSKPNAFAYLPTVFTDNTLVVGSTTAKAQHIIELRQAVDAMRAVAGLSGAPWTDPALAAGDTIKAIHILDLRTYLDDAATRLGYSTSPYTDPALSTGYSIKRIHIEELRQRIRVIAG